MKEEGGEGVELEQEGEESRDKDQYEGKDFGTQDEVTTINIILSIDTCIK